MKVGVIWCLLAGLFVFENDDDICFGGSVVCSHFPSVVTLVVFMCTSGKCVLVEFDEGFGCVLFCNFHHFFIVFE